MHSSLTNSLELEPTLSGKKSQVWYKFQKVVLTHRFLKFITPEMSRLNVEIVSKKMKESS
jgi:hypothetical protein